MLSTTFATLLHGAPDQIADEIDGAPLDDTEIRAILINLCRRVAVAERVILNHCHDHADRS